MRNQEVPPSVSDVLNALGFRFRVWPEPKGFVCEVAGCTDAGGEMIHCFDFRHGSRVDRVCDWADEARRVLDAFDAFDVAEANKGLVGAPRGEELYEDVKSYKEAVLKPLVDAIAFA